MDDFFIFSQKVIQMLSKSIRSGFQGEKMVVVPKGLFTRVKEHQLLSCLYLTDIGFFPRATDHYRKRKRGSGEYILIYCIDGRGVVELNGIKHQLKPNSFFIIERKKPHTYYAHKMDPWSIYWIHFKGSHAPYLYDRFVTQSEGNPILIPYEQNKIAEFEYLLGLFQLGYTNQVLEYATMMLHNLIGSFIYYSVKSRSKREIANDDLVKRIIKFLNDKITESIKLKDLELHFKKSNTALYKIFKEKTGYSIMHFFGLIKVQKACELMNLTNQSIKEISFGLGFQDPLYFSRVFKKYMGVSPKQYRLKR
ncbi:MAG: AraC family transcriptional regulator [Bacteroidota bacterium]